MRGEGRIYKRGDRWWIEYWVRGQQYRESAGAKETEAKRALKARLREIHGERFVGPEAERLSVDDILDAYVTHLRQRGARSVGSTEAHLRPVREFFTLVRAIDLTTSRIRRFIQARTAAGKAPATVNRSLQALRAAYRLAMKENRLSRAPYFPLLREENARQGFFERAEFDAVVAHLREPVCEIARFAYLSGWRKGEILPLRWEAVDRAAREIRLATSKNGRGRVLPLEGELQDMIERRWAAREYERLDGTTALAEQVFHVGGRPVGDFKHSWATACKKAGVPGKLFHDLRRTAVRSMIRAGVPQSVAMAISGHRTVSMFLRYNITSDEDEREALRRTQDYLRAQPTETNVRKLVGSKSDVPDGSRTSSRTIPAQ